MSYQLTIEDRTAYLHAKVTGERTPENARRYLEETYAACAKRGRASVLLDMQFTGPSLSPTSIYEILTQRIPDGLKLGKIAYVQSNIADPAMPYFAEMVAANRGVNVRVFQNLAAARRWLTDNE